MTASSKARASFLKGCRKEDKKVNLDYFRGMITTRTQRIICRFCCFALLIISCGGACKTLTPAQTAMLAAAFESSPPQPPPAQPPQSFTVDTVELSVVTTNTMQVQQLAPASTQPEFTSVTGAFPATPVN